MSHRKRVRAWWNRKRREEQFAQLKAALPVLFKRAYPKGLVPREFVYRGSPLLGLLPKDSGRR